MIFLKNSFLFLVAAIYSINVLGLDGAILYSSKNRTLLDSKCMEYDRINPAIYRVRVSCKDDSYILDFNELYSEGWKVYFSPPMKASDLHNIDYSLLEKRVIKKDNIYSIESGLSPSVGHSVLLPDELHFRKDKFFNGWIINKELIEFLLSNNKNIKTMNDQEYTLYIVFYSEVIKQVWKNIMYIIIALIGILLFFKRMIVFFNYKKHR